jgi:hypothetical protein
MSDQSGIVNPTPGFQMLPQPQSDKVLPEFGLERASLR